MATRKAKTTKATTPSKTTRSTKTTKRAAKSSAPKTERKVLDKKVAVKKTPETKVVETKVSVADTSKPKNTRSLPAMKVKRSYLIAAVIVVALLGLAYYYRSLFVVAMVNGQPISRFAYITELERMSGQQAMNALVTKKLILQEADKQNVSVSDEEVDKEIASIEANLKSQGQDLNSVLTLQGLTREALREQIYLQKLIEKMVGDKVKVTDEEVATYIENNQDTLPQDQSEEEQKKAVREQLKQQKLNEQVQSWLQKLQQDAQINYLISR